MTEKLIFDMLLEWQDYYDKSFTDYVKRLYINFLKNTPDEYSDRINEAVYRSCKFMPRIADLAEILQSIHTQENNSKVKVQNQKHCWYCMNKGLIRYEREIDGYTYQFISYCPYCKKGSEYAATKGIRNASDVFGDKLRDVAKENYNFYNRVDRKKASNEAKELMKVNI